MATAAPLPPIDEQSDEESLVGTLIAERKAASARVLEILDRARPQPEIAAMSDDEIMELACAEVRAYRREKAEKASRS